MKKSIQKKSSPCFATKEKHIWTDIQTARKHADVSSEWLCLAHFVFVFSHTQHPQSVVWEIQNVECPLRRTFLCKATCRCFQDCELPVLASSYYHRACNTWRPANKLVRCDDTCSGAHSYNLLVQVSLLNHLRSFDLEFAFSTYTMGSMVCWATCSRLPEEACKRLVLDSRRNVAVWFGRKVNILVLCAHLVGVPIHFYRFQVLAF